MISDRKTPQTDDLEIVDEILWYGKNIACKSERTDGKTWREAFNEEVGELVDFARRLKRERDAAVEALKLCYDHCRLWHPEIEINNVGETIRDILRAIEESKS